MRKIPESRVHGCFGHALSLTQHNPGKLYPFLNDILLRSKGCARFKVAAEPVHRHSEFPGKSAQGDIFPDAAVHVPQDLLDFLLSLGSFLAARRMTAVQFVYKKEQFRQDYPEPDGAAVLPVPGMFMPLGIQAGKVFPLLPAQLPVMAEIVPPISKAA
jgi:hypothetical protein